ncbi:helix-turn-helix domain-containing protein [Streptomyces sp. NPDC056468]|uniref:helix-turn-helix domain-containing protein n=1 Tax=Streptomyces sp. NPDC056468 TaxID=3345830 RepID=UPI0036BF1351
MPGPKDLDPSSSPRALLGAELRHVRERRGLSQEALGLKLFVSGTFIGQLEAGTRRLRPDLAPMLDEALGTDGFFERNCQASNKSRHPEHFAEAAEATVIRQYTPMLIPGLLQTPAYARAVNRAYAPTAPEQTIDDWVEGRMARTRLLDHPTKPLLWAVLDEAALRRVTGGRAVMAEALHHLAGLAGRNRVMMQVLPFSAGAHAAMQGALKLMDFEDAPPLIYFEAVRTGHLDDDPATVAQLRLTFEYLTASALSPEKSLALIESLAQDYDHEEHP